MDSAPCYNEANPTVHNPTIGDSQGLSVVIYTRNSAHVEQKLASERQVKNTRRRGDLII